MALRSESNKSPLKRAAKLLVLEHKKRDNSVGHPKLFPKREGLDGVSRLSRSTLQKHSAGKPRSFAMPATISF
eukprot:5417946-Amphidinium_carterae.1